MEIENHIIAFIRNIPMFQGMSSLELNAISAFLETRKYKKGDIIFYEGDTGSEIYILKSGKVGMYMKCPDLSLREVYHFSQGSFFGEMSILENETRSATCKVQEDAELLIIDGLDFHRLVWEHPVLGIKVLNAMTKVMVSWLGETTCFLQDLLKWGETAKKRAVTDDTSLLFNRRFIEQSMKIDFSKDTETEIHTKSLLMLDLDNFRNINAEFGSDAGNSILLQAGLAFSRVIPPSCIASRLSGDEFAFYLSETSYESALKIAEVIRKEIEDLYLEFRVQGKENPVRVFLKASIGVSTFPHKANNYEDLFKSADAALFNAKESGRNCVR